MERDAASRLRELAAWLREGDRLPRLLWLAAVFAFLGYYKLRHASHKAGFAIDGGYYADIARHVRDGEGLTTNVSLYHQAFSYFPHETPVSPLWPLLFGYVSRVFDLFTVGVWLPAMLYFVALAAGYAWATRLSPDSFFPDRVPGFGAGHVFVLMLGMHREFFHFTSMPYTEGLAYSLLLLGLWRLHAIWPRLDLRGGLEVGAWLGVLMLARGQFFLLAIAVFMTYGWAIIALSEHRRQHLTACAASAVVFVAIVGSYWVLFLDDAIGAPPQVALLRFDQAWETPVLSEFHPMVNTSGLWETLKDRYQGIDVAFSRKGRYAYKRSYYLFQYAVVAVLPFLVLWLLRRRRQWREDWTWLRSPAALPWMMLVLFAIGGFTSLHLIHKDYFSSWHFPRRQGLTALFIFFLSLIFLLKQRRAALAVGVFLLCAGTYVGHDAVERQTAAVVKNNERSLRHYRTDLVAWLNAQGKMTVAMSAHEPQKLAVVTPDIGYHWIFERTTPADVDVMMTKLGATHLLLTRGSLRWQVRRGDKEFAKKYRRVKSFGDVTVYERIAN